jgi:hypothetical protein
LSANLIAAENKYKKVLDFICVIRYTYIVRLIKSYERIDIMYRYIPKDILISARAGIDDIPIKPAIGGIKVYRKFIKHDDILEHMQKLLWRALEALYDIEDETPKGKTMEEYLDSILISQSGFLGKSMTNRDVKAYAISKVKECIAIIEYCHR